LFSLAGASFQAPLMTASLKCARSAVQPFRSEHENTSSDKWQEHLHKNQVKSHKAVLTSLKTKTKYQIPKYQIKRHKAVLTSLKTKTKYQIPKYQIKPHKAVLTSLKTKTKYQNTRSNPTKQF